METPLSAYHKIPSLESGQFFSVKGSLPSGFAVSREAEKGSPP
jgi:hypothetical protein